jgi:integrase
LLGAVTGKRPEMTINEAFGRYFLEHGQHLPSSDEIDRYSATLMKAVGKHTLLSEITANKLAEHMARRRATLANGTVNREVGHLRTVIIRARDVWKVATPEIEWKKLWLEEPESVQHILSADEEKRLFAALRPDYHPLVRFALLSGQRLDNVRTLAWRQIDWQARTISFRVKSKKPGGSLRYVPITNELAALLSVERGRHPVYVFTYALARNRYDPERKQIQVKGVRYPFSKHGWRKAWKRALEEAEIENFRFHDLRHTAGTRALRATGNLRTVQKMLGHKDIQTTLRYTASEIEDIRAAMEAVAQTHSDADELPRSERVK